MTHGCLLNVVARENEPLLVVYKTGTRRPVYIFNPEYFVFPHPPLTSDPFFYYYYYLLNFRLFKTKKKKKNIYLFPGTGRYN